MQWVLRRLTYANIAASLALFIALGGTAYAATGGIFILGQTNAESTKAVLSNPNGTPLGLGAKKGAPPLSVNSTGKVTNLNADLVDGKHASAFQAPLKLQRVQTIIGKYGGSIYCPAGYRVTGGGYDYGPPGWYTTTGQFVIGSYPTLGAQGWTVGTEPSVVSGSVIGQIWAICVK